MAVKFHRKSNSLIIRHPQPEAIAALIPRAKIATVAGDKLLQVHCGLDEMRVLRNIGIAAPSPIRFHYDFPSRYPSPFSHQVSTCEFFTLNQRGICLNGMGTGKSLSTLWAADFLMRKGKIRKALIVCPISTMHSVWANEVNSHFLTRRKIVVLHGSRAKRLKMLDTDADFYVINYEGLSVLFDELKARDDIDLWVVDEAAAYREAQNNRYKILKRLLRPTTWLWMLTGTPTPNKPTDAWALAKLLGNPDVDHYFSAFREKTMIQVSDYKWVAKPTATDDVFKILQPGIRFRKEDCLDLPPVTYQLRTCEMTKAQKVAYQQMHDYLVATVDSTPVSAANAAVKMQKLLQVCVGTLYDNDGGHRDLDANPRLSLVKELVEQAADKTIVFVPFTGALNRLKTYLSSDFKVEVVDGRTPVNERRRIFSQFQNSEDVQVLVMHPKVAAHGLTLTRADTTVWYAPIFSLETFLQANERTNRPGQKNAMTVAMVASTPMEESLYSALRGNAKIQDALLDLYKKEVSMK